MHKKLRLELPGKVLPPLPRQNKANATLTQDDDDDSVSSESSLSVAAPDTLDPSSAAGGGGLRGYLLNHKRNTSATSFGGRRGSRSPRASGDNLSYKEPRVLFREEQRVSLRAFVRTLLQNQLIANSSAMAEFLTSTPITLNEEELEDCDRRKEMDEKRLEEGRQFYEIARKRAAELDVHMEKFRREIVESSKFQRFY